jgi:hypothetical protein
MASSQNIELIKQPPSLALLDEGLNFEVLCTSLFGKTQASIYLEFPDSQTVYLDKSFEMSAMGEMFLFTFKENPDNSGLNLRTWDIEQTFAEFLQQVCDDISLNYIFAKNYIIWPHNSAGIAFLAYETGSLFSLDLDNTDITGLTVTNNIPGNDGSMPADYRIYFAPVFYNNLRIGGQPIGEDLVPLNGNNIAISDLQEYLRPFLKSSFSFPYNGSLTNVLEDACKKFYIRFAEFYNGQFTQLQTTYDHPIWVMAGGLKKIDSDFLSDENTDYFAYMNNDKRFLTHSPATKITMPGMPERLFFIHSKTLMHVKVKEYYATGEVVSTIDSISEETYTVFEILCGAHEIFIGKDISELVKYDVWVEDDKENIISEIKTFILDHSEYLNVRTIVFRNSFNMYDMLHCTGDLKISDNVKRKEIEVLTDNAFRRRISERENISSYSLNSGWLKQNGKQTRQWLEELLLSDDVYLAMGDFLLPVILKTGKIQRQKDRENLYGIDILFEPDFNDSRYSNIVGNILNSDPLDILTDKIYDQYRTIVTDDGGTINSESISKKVIKQLLLQ